MIPHRSWWRRLFGLCLPGEDHEWRDTRTVLSHELPVPQPAFEQRCSNCYAERTVGPA